jgi:ATP-dependent helicase/nuclease subunit B
MTDARAKIVSCPLGADLLAVLAERLRHGTLIPDAAGLPLYQWRIFLPTRRAVRRLRGLLARGKSMALPHILPIGDVDEDELAANRQSFNIPLAISQDGLLFEVMGQLSRWAQENQRFAIAREIASSPIRLQHLAKSLVDLLHQSETEERSLTGVAAVYDLDLAEHREAIIDLLNLVTQQLPIRLDAEKRIGPSSRRNLLIRELAADIRQRDQAKPVVIAGSTGTNPATRDLIAAIAARPNGLVVLPGLASDMSTLDWQSLPPTHPQFNLKTLLDQLQITAASIPDMTKGFAARRWLMQETMRPPSSSSYWNEVLHKAEARCREALQGLRLVAAPDRHAEALAIALMLRKAESEGRKSIALITPDRDLARRVASELHRWGLQADDTHGHALTERGRAQLLTLVLDARLEDFSPHSLLALLHHPLATFGMTDDIRGRALQLFDMFVLRQHGLGGTLEGIAHALDRATLERSRAREEEPIRMVSDDNWLDLASYLARMRSAFASIASQEPRELAWHVDALQRCLGLIAPEGDDVLAPHLEAAFEDLSNESHRLPNLNLPEVMPLIFGRLARTTLRAPPGKSAIGIYGLLEARLMHFETVVVGGLNEGVWPGSPDPGPWLNRPMREQFQLQQPERDIGLTAHDFVSTLSSPEVTITWAERIGTEPAIPSRWILRLRAVMEACGIPTSEHCDTHFVDLALRLDRPGTFNPVAKPKPTVDPVFAPRNFSVTEIETLLRNPYAIYARKLLRIKPLRQLAEEPDARLRGILFHDALKRWNEQQPHGTTIAPLADLITAGREIFLPVGDDPDVQAFWWPRFLRMAEWIVAKETDLQPDVIDRHAEVMGSLQLVIEGETFGIRAKADRIDVMAGGAVRVIDYKTGDPPTSPQVSSGFSPQLTLEAAMIRDGGFPRMGLRATQDARYIKASGGRDPGKMVEIGKGKDGFDIMDKAQEHWDGLRVRLAALLDPDCPYPPRVMPFKEDKPQDYDHLSRYREWSLSE